jgi:uncharacterized protein (DUF849 family)
MNLGGDIEVGGGSALLVAVAVLVLKEMRVGGEDDVWLTGGIISSV